MAGKGTIRWEKRKGGARVPFLDYRPFGRIYADRDALGLVTPFRTAEDAQRVRERIRRAVDDGIALETAVLRFLPASRNTVYQRAQAWALAKEREAAAGRIELASLDNLQRYVRDYFVWWENAPIQGVKRGDVEDWIQDLYAHGLADSTVRGILAMFKAFLRWVHDREEIDRLPRFPSVQVPERALTFLSRDEQDQVLAAIDEPQRGIFLFLVDTACRPSEARAVGWQDVEVRDGVPWVWFRRAFKGPLGSSPIKPYTKTRRSGDAPISERCWEWMQAHGDPSQPFVPMFRSQRGLWGASNLNKTWKAASARAGVPLVPVREATRHSTLQRVRDEHGAEMAALLARHENVATTLKHYTRSDRRRLLSVSRRSV